MREAHLARPVKLVKQNRLLGQRNKLIYFSCPGADFASHVHRGGFGAVFSPRVLLLLLFSALFFFFSRKKGEPVNMGEANMRKFVQNLLRGVGGESTGEPNKKAWFTDVHQPLLLRISILYPPQVVVEKLIYVA